MEVRFENLEKKYGDFYAVRDLSLTIEDGALHFLLGPSGCGKTTSLRMLAGLEKPTGGKILFDGEDVTDMPSAERGIGMVFQNYALWPHMTVQGNVEYGLKLRKLSAAEMKKRMDEVINITQLQGFEQRLPGQLSGGQQQRVALARALAVRPNVLLLDEPLSNLDAKLRLEMRDNISRIHKLSKITTVYVTHDQKEALSMGTAVSVMRQARLIQTDTPRKLYYHPATAFIASFIGETNLIEGKVLSTGGDGLLVQTDCGKIKAASAAGEVKPDDRVFVSIRPEAIEIRDTASDAVNSFKYKLDHLTYLGESEQLQISTADGSAPLKATIFHAPEEGRKDGDEIYINIDPQDALVLPHEDVIGGT